MHLYHRSSIKISTQAIFLSLIPFVLYLTSASSSTALPRAETSLVRSGPMVGFGGHQEVTLWLQTHKPGLVQFKYWPKGQPKRAKMSAKIATDQAHHLIAKPTLSALPSGTHFEYQVFVDGIIQRFDYPLKFQTQVRWQRKTSPPDFKMAIGSCAYFNLDDQDHYGGGYGIFEQIRSQSPDIMLWLGDNLYLGPEDWSSTEGIYRRYGIQRSQASIQALLGSVHHYAIWDDHDYGSNDANRSFPLKGASRKAFQDFWANPSYGLPELPGVFGIFSWSDVDVFLLDDRTYRAAGNTPDSRDKPLLGDAQLQWLLDALAASRATFKIIAIGSQVLNPFSRFEGYSQHAVEKTKLLQGIQDYQIEGVVFLSGDRHFTELNKLNIDPWFYPLYDFTSSPLTSGVASSVEDERINPLRVPGTLIADQRSFGMVSVIGRGEERQIQLSALNEGGQVLWTRSIKASELKIPKSL